MKGLGFRVHGLGFKVLDFGLRVKVILALLGFLRQRLPRYPSDKQGDRSF